MEPAGLATDRAVNSSLADEGSLLKQRTNQVWDYRGGARGECIRLRWNERSSNVDEAIIPLTALVTDGTFGPLSARQPLN